MALGPGVVSCGFGRETAEFLCAICFAGRAFAVKIAAKRLLVYLLSGLLKDCKGHKTHRFENGGTNQLRKTGKREAVLCQPLPQTLYTPVQPNM